MKFFRYWVENTFNITIGEQVEAIKLLVGSNISEQDAERQAQQRAQLIEQRIAQGELPDAYEVAIKEHVEKIIDDNNIITVCRYGAKILNTTQYTIFDLDHYPVDFFDFVKPVRKLPTKERIVAKFLQRLKRYPELGKDFRIYETTKGIRVIGKQYLEPTEKNNQRLLQKLNVDWLYTILSQKQNCYRARITPKPYRLRIPTIKIRSPLVCQTNAYQQWTKLYQNASERYSVVKLVQIVGNDFSHEPIIQLHDQHCREALRGTLA